MRRFLLILASLVLVSNSALSVEPDEILPYPALELRARALSKALRCMVCQNQSIDDSDAPLARDLRIIVRERIKAGDNDEQVRDFLVARYGEFVLLEPRLSAHTVMLWGIPCLVLALGAAAMVFLRQNRTPAAALSREEERKLAKIIKRSGDLTNL
jgi:cytochrome c-type biogenesis protein CcmH